MLPESLSRRFGLAPKSLVRAFRVLALTVLCVVAFGTSATGSAAEVQKANNTDLMIHGTSWTGGTAPSNGDVALFDALFTQASAGAGGPLSWGGVRVTTGSGLVWINNTSNYVGVGASGLDLSAAARDLTVQMFQQTASHTWTIATGRTVTVGATAFTQSAGTALTLTGSGSAVFASAASVTVGDLSGFSGTLTNSGTTTLNPATGVSQSLAGSITGTGRVSKSGAGTYAFDGSTSYTGGTTISAGTLALGASERLADTGALNVSGGTFDLGGFAETVGAVTLKSGTITNGTLTGSSYAFEGGDVSAVLAGPGALTMSKAGTVTLGGSNTYSGGTTVSTGKLVGSAASIQGTIVNDAAVEFTDSVAGTYSGAMSGKGSVTMSGGGALTLTGASSYTGGTAISAGKLALGASERLADTGALTVSGGTFDLGGFAETVGAVTLTSGTITNGTLIGSSYAFQSGDVSAVLAGSGGLAKTTSGTVTLSGANTYSGTTTVSVGTLVVTGSGAVGSGDIVVPDGTLTFNRSSATTLANAFSVQGAGTTPTLLNEGAGLLTIQAGSNTNIPVDPGEAFSIGGSGSIRIEKSIASGGTSALVTKTGSGTVTLTSASNAWSGGTTISAGVLQVGDGTSNGTIGSGTITLTNGRLAFNRPSAYTVAESFAAFASSTTPGIENNGAGTLTINASKFTFGTGVQLTFGGTGVGLVSGVIAPGNAGASMIKDGVGTWTFDDANGYTGTTTVNAGTLEITGTLGGTVASVKQSAGNYAQTIAINGGALSFNTTSNQTLSGDITGAGALLKANTGTLTLTGTNSYSGGTTISAGTLNIGGGGATGSPGSGNITDNSAIVVNRTGTLEIPGGISGTGTLAKQGSGTLTLSGTNTFTGTATITAGTLQVGNGGTTGTLSAGSVVDNAALAFNRSDALAVANAISGTGTLTQAGSGTTTLSGANTYSGGTNVNAGTLALGSSGALGSTGTIAFGGGALQFSASNTTDYSARFSSAASQQYRLDTNGQSVTLASALTSSGGSMTKLGSGTLTLSGANTFSGGTNVSAGTLALGSSGALGSTGTITFGGGTLQFSASNTTDYSARFSSAASQQYRLDTNGQSVTLASALTSGGGSMTKLGSGTLTLSGTNTYSGATSVSAGTLRINGSQSGATGAVTVASGATLGGTGTVGGAIAVQSGATLAPGSSPGILAAAAGLTLSTGSAFQWELVANKDTATGTRGTDFDGVNVTGGTLAIGAGVTSQLIFNGTGSAVDFTNSFWQSNHSWLVFSDTNAPTLSSAAAIFDTISAGVDRNGVSLTSVSGRANARFYWVKSGNNVLLYYSAGGSAATSTVSASPASIAANGSATSTLTVQLKNAAGEDLSVSGGTVTFATPGQGSIGSVTDNQNGTWTATYTAGSTAGSVTIQPKLDGANFTNTTSITLTAGTATKLVISTIADQVVNRAFAVTVTLTDANGNAVNNATADSTITLTKKTGTGTLGGTLSGTLAVGQSAVTISGVTYGTVETGVSLTATGTGTGGSADGKTGDSNLFNVTSGSTLAVVSDVRAYTDGGRVWLEWETASQFGSAGFVVMRADAASDGKFVRVHDGLLPALIAAPQGGIYRYSDGRMLPGSSYTIRIDELEASGNVISHGPFPVTVASSGGEAFAALSRTAAAASKPNQTAVATPGQVTPGLGMTRGQSATFQSVARVANGRHVAATAGATASGAATNGTGLTVNALGATTSSNATVTAVAGTAAATVTPNAAVRIVVENDGLYTVGADEIAAALGANVQNVRSWLASGQMRLRQEGQQVAWRSDARGTVLQFYGQAPSGLDAIYTKANVYWLDRGSGTTMKQVARPPIGTAGTGQSFLSTVHVEENHFPDPFIGTTADADVWFWGSVYSLPSETPVAQTFAVPAPNASGTGTATLRVSLQGAFELITGNDQRALVAVNGQDIGNLAWNGIDRAQLTASFPGSLLRTDGVANTVSVRAEQIAGAPWSMFLVDSFDLDYQRVYQAQGDQLKLRAPNAKTMVTVAGFGPAGTISVLDISKPMQPQWITGATVTSSAGSRSVRFAAASTTADYLVAIPKAPVAIQGAPAPTLKNANNGNEYLVLTPAALRAGANALATYRAGKVVELQSIYDEFGDGIANPYAIRDFLAYASTTWKVKPKFVALIGKGTFDPKDYQGYGTNRFPVLLAATPDGVFQSDARFVDFNDDGVPQLALGRIPALDDADVTAYLAKVKAYEAAGRRPANQALVVADNPDQGGNFTADSRIVAQALQANGYTTLPVYLGEAPTASTAEAKAGIFAALNSAAGVGLFNYVGHGGTQVLAKEALLSNASGDTSVSQISNLGKLPIFIAMTCRVGDGAYPGWDSLTEALIWAPTGGVVGAFVATGLSQDAEAHKLNLSLVATMTGPQAKATLGEAAMAALADYQANGGQRFMLDLYSVVGDPALRLQR